MKDDDVMALLKVMHDRFDFSVSDETAPFVRQATLRTAARSQSLGYEVLVMRAHAGDVDAQALCCHEAAMRLQRGETLPEHFHHFVVGVFQAYARQVDRDGRDYKNIKRNVFIVAAVNRLLAELPHLRATRGKDKHGSDKKPSACSFVARLLNMSEPAVEDVWQSTATRSWIPIS
jgi:hypothetical protein